MDEAGVSLMSLPEGIVLKGTYRIVRFIGSGGFGCTYEATHVLLGKRVAIKEFFAQDFCNRDGATAHVTVGTESRRPLVEKMKGKFIDKARAMSRMKHKRIVGVTDVFEENGTAYYVMDYIAGRSLDRIVREEGRLPERRAVKYVLQVCEALDYVHSLKRLHMDVKPGNIMIDGNDEAVLIDFGASKQYDESGEGTSTLMGKTPGYAPPEQTGSNVKRFNAALDIYALGATLYKLLSGNTPPAPELRYGGVEVLAPLPGDVSDGVRRAVAAAMQLNRNDRPQTVKAFAAMLSEGTDERTTIDEPAPGDERGTLRVDYKPSGVEVWIDGSRAGVTGDAALLFGGLSAGSHDVELRKKGYGTVTYKSLTVTAGGTCGISGELKEDTPRPVPPPATRQSTPRAASSAGWKKLLLCAAILLGCIVAAYLGNKHKVEATQTSGIINGHGYVDLGLSVKWATCNVGAGSPEDYGGYYAWGETETKSSYDEDNCETWEKKIGDIGGTSRDVAHVKWGGTWRLPTMAEINELRDNCTWTRTTLNGVNGYKVTSEKNGNSIFLPAAGWRRGTSLHHAGEDGYYWGSTPYESGTQNAYYLGVFSGNPDWYWHYRYGGRSVRPVSE